MYVFFSRAKLRIFFENSKFQTLKSAINISKYTILHYNYYKIVIFIYKNLLFSFIFLIFAARKF